MHLNREHIKHHQRIVVKIGSSSLTHKETGRLDLSKMEVLVRQLSDLRNRGKDVILVSSGAIMVGMQTIGLERKPHSVSRKQACASIGQARLMLSYQKLFSEYNQTCSQILMTKQTILIEKSRYNAKNTFEELLDLGVIPVVNENDTISTEEIEFGDNDTLSAVVAALVHADLLILLSDIDGLYDDDPNRNPHARFIPEVPFFTSELDEMAKGSVSRVGTGGMTTKIKAARIASASGAETIIANGEDFHILKDLLDGAEIGTLFKCHPIDQFSLEEYLEK
ncbi:MAG: glutamate 5-kinase [Erysipelotrichaceae bacterium]|nr:glutamate 5-kinase [Erysipelotrichaceae bacterium]